MSKINSFWTVFILILIELSLLWNYGGAGAIAAEKSDNISDTCNQALSPNSSVTDKTRTGTAMTPEDVDSGVESQSIADITQASFWWAAEQFDPFNGKLVQNWLTSPKKQEINLVVNWQLWTLLDYFGRYRFVNQFGTVARKYGYSLNVFNQKAQCLASYKYNPFAVPPKWELNLGKIGRDSLPIEPQKISDQ